MIKTICYTSKVKSTLDLLALEALFNETQTKNNNHNITGVLVKLDDNFFQIIEGNKTILDPLFKKIKKDSRHYNIKELLNKSITKLSFTNFDTGYSIIQDMDSLYRLQTYITQIENNDTDNNTVFLKIIEDLLSSD